MDGETDVALKAYNFAWEHTFGTLFTLLIPALNYLPTQHNNLMIKSLQDLDSVFFSLIEKSKKSVEKGEISNLLDLMVEANNKGKLGQEEGEEHFAKLTDSELRDNVAIFFVAGHETVCNTDLTILVFNYTIDCN